MADAPVTFTADEWYRETAGFSLELSAAYANLAYQCNSAVCRGTLPDDDDRLQSWSRLDLAAYRACKKKLLRAFVINQEGRWSHERLCPAWHQITAQSERNRLNRSARKKSQPVSVVPPTLFSTSIPNPVPRPADNRVLIGADPPRRFHDVATEFAPVAGTKVPNSGSILKNQPMVPGFQGGRAETNCGPVGNAVIRVIVRCGVGLNDALDAIAWRGAGIEDMDVAIGLVARCYWIGRKNRTGQPVKNFMAYLKAARQEPADGDQARAKAELMTELARRGVEECVQVGAAL